MAFAGMSDVKVTICRTNEQVNDNLNSISTADSY